MLKNLHGVSYCVYTRIAHIICNHPVLQTPCQVGSLSVRHSTTADGLQTWNILN